MKGTLANLHTTVFRFNRPPLFSSRRRGRIDRAATKQFRIIVDVKQHDFDNGHNDSQNGNEDNDHTHADIVFRALAETLLLLLLLLLLLQRLFRLPFLDGRFRTWHLFSFQFR